MPRPAKPYLSRGWYVTNLGGKRQQICPAADGLRAAGEALVRLQGEIADNGGRPFPVAVHTPALPNADSEQSRPVFFEKWNALTVQPGRPGA